MTTFLSTDLRYDAYTWLALEMPWGGWRAFYVPVMLPPDTVTAARIRSGFDDHPTIGEARKRESARGSGYQKTVQNDG